MTPSRRSVCPAAPALVGQREQEVLGRDVVVLEPLGLAGGRFDQTGQARRDVWLGGARQLAEAVQRGLELPGAAPVAEL